MNQQHIPRLLAEDRVGLLIQAFLDDCELADHSPRTLANYRDTLSKFHWWLRATDRPLDPTMIRPADLRDYLRYIQSAPNRWNSTDPKAHQPIQASTLDAYYRRLRAFFNWLVDQEDIDRSPMDKRLRRPRVPEQPIDPFTADELTRIAHVLRNRPENVQVARDRAVVAVLLDVALRASELVNLIVSDVDIMTGSVLVRQGKGNKTRSVQLGSSARRALRRYWIRFRADDYNMSEPVFLSQRRTPLTRSGLEQLTKRIGNQAGVDPCNPHRFRHTAAVNAVRAGMDVFHLQRLLGHSDLEMCRRYVQLADTDMANAAKRSSPLDHLKLNL